MADAVYVYGVVAGGAPLELPAGVEDAEARVEESSGLAALVSSVPDRPIRATRKNLEAHASVLASALSQRDPVLPMRFGILLPDQAAVAAELLEPSRPELETLLGRFAGPVALA